jgi:hypothetical protein
LLVAPPCPSAARRSQPYSEAMRSCANASGAISCNEKKRVRAGRECACAGSPQVESGRLYFLRCAPLTVRVCGAQQWLQTAGSHGTVCSEAGQKRMPDAKRGSLVLHLCSIRPDDAGERRRDSKGAHNGPLGSRAGLKGALHDLSSPSRPSLRSVSLCLCVLSCFPPSVCRCAVLCCGCCWLLAGLSALFSAAAQKVSKGCREQRERRSAEQRPSGAQRRQQNLGARPD